MGFGAETQLMLRPSLHILPPGPQRSALSTMSLNLLLICTVLRVRMLTFPVFQMALRPIVQADGRPPVRPLSKMSDRYEAVTRYRVLTENGSAALVECTPETGVCCAFVRDEKTAPCWCSQTVRDGDFV